MKRIIFSLLFLLLSFLSFCQQNMRSVHDKDYYLNRSRHLQTTGWILAGTGSVAVVAGILVIKNTKNASGLDDALNNSIGGLLLTTAGTAAVIASVPMFIFSGVMKKRAAMLSFQNQRILLPNANNFVARMQPAISLSVHF